MSIYSQVYSKSDFSFHISASNTDDLLESDRLYFEANSDIKVIPRAVISVMPHLTHIPAGCVVHRINITDKFERWQDWIIQVEQQLKHLGCHMSRLYLDRPIPELEKVLRAHQYSCHIEVGLLDEHIKASKLSTDLDVSLRLIKTEDDWQQKRVFHSEAEKGPDGHITCPDDWIDLEQRKCETGLLRLYFIFSGDSICGTVGAMEVNNLLRLKNLVIHPQWRRRGVAKSTVRALRNEAIRMDKQAFGCFALEGSVGQRVYERAGLSIVTQQTEWHRILH